VEILPGKKAVSENLNVTLPKVLIIGQPFNNDTGGGVTISNLFKGWDSEKLAVLCFTQQLSFNIDASLCKRYYQLGHKERAWVFPFNLLAKKHHSGPVTINNRIKNISGNSKISYRSKILNNYILPFARYIGLYPLTIKTRLSNELVSWINDYNPDIIYAQGSSRSDILFCTAITKLFQKPIIFHVMDDWPSLYNEKGIFKKYWHRRTEKEFKNLLDQSCLLLTICDEMSDEYLRRYNKPSIAFHNAVDLRLWQPYARQSYDLADQPTILYAGRTGLGINSSLESIARAIDEINKENKLSIKFILQTQNLPQWVSKYRCLEKKSYVSYADIPKVFSSADILILPYDFSSTSKKYIRYSMPTKAPEYMASGTPIIILSPECTALAKYAIKYKWALTITKNEVAVIKREIKEFISNKTLRETMSHNAIGLAKKNHDLTKVSMQFKDTLTAIVNNH